MTKRYKISYLNLGLFSFIIGICSIILLFIIPIASFPLLILAIMVYVLQKQKRFSVYAKIGLVLWIVGFIFFIMIGFANLDMDLYLSSSVNCEKLTEVECLEFSRHCQLCGETIASSYAGCHSIKFCETIPVE